MLVSIEHVVAEYLIKSGIPVSSLPLQTRATDEHVAAEDDSRETVKMHQTDAAI